MRWQPAAYRTLSPGRSAACGAIASTCLGYSPRAAKGFGPRAGLLPRGFLVWLLLWTSAPAHAQPPAGSFTEAQCVACHGPDSPEVHGWRMSKHGVLAKIGAPDRAPGCVDCHTAEAHRPADAARMQETCGRCHSPRYMETLRANGERMIEVGNMKQREAAALLDRARREFPAPALVEMEGRYRNLLKHLRNLRLGVAHQSPDYQWWHGHPALDGDLLRIKGAYDELMRSGKPPR